MNDCYRCLSGTATLWWQVPPVGNFCFFRKKLKEFTLPGKRIGAIMHSQGMLDNMSTCHW